MKETEVEESRYKELLRFPFVRPIMKGKLAIHDVIREIIDENLHTQDPGRHEDLHSRAAEYFRGQIGTALSSRYNDKERDNAQSG